MDSFNITIFHDHDDKDVKDEICLGNLRYMQELLSSWPGYESIVKKLKRTEENFYKRGLQSVTLQKNGLAVLIHGDLWVNNFMFKREGKNPIDVLFIDLQIAYYGSLGMDINFFLNTSVQVDVLKSKRYELLRTYYDSLKKTLEQLNYVPIPSWEQVKNEIRATEFYGFFGFEAILPLLSIDRNKSKDNSFDSFSDKEKMLKNRECAFQSKRMVEMLKYSLDRFDELKVFD